VKFKARESMKSGTINWPKILTDEHTRMVYNEHLLSLTTPGIDYDDYQETILNAGKLTAIYHKRQCSGWFQLSRTTLSPLLMERIEVLHATNRCHHLPAAIQATMRANLKQLNRHIAHAVSHAKATWYADICQKIHDMNMEPRLAWEHIHILTKGESAHHQRQSTIAMQLPNGKRATTAAENMSVFAPHFQRVLNNHRPVDLEFANHVPQRRTLWELNDPITWNEFTRAVTKLKMPKPQVSPVFRRKLSKPCPLQIYAMYTTTVMIFSWA
jgi:hypothetical protein